MARDMMDLVQERVSAGRSDADIQAELLASFSGAVLLDPPFGGRTLVLWLAPFLVLVIGGVVIIRWRAQEAEATPVGDTATSRSRPRVITGALILIVSLAGIVAIASNSLQRGDGATAGVADLAGTNLSDISNETLEAVIAANAEHPQISGMRLALAERYFEQGDYRSAFPHYLAVADSQSATDAEVVTSLVRLGWMAYDGNGEAETALNLFDEALEIDAGSQAALYLKGTVLWCGEGDEGSAAIIFADLLADPDLPADSRTQVEADLSRIETGENCA